MHCMDLCFRYGKFGLYQRNLGYIKETLESKGLSFVHVVPEAF